MINLLFLLLSFNLLVDYNTCYRVEFNDDDLFYAANMKIKEMAGEEVSCDSSKIVEIACQDVPATQYPEAIELFCYYRVVCRGTDSVEICLEKGLEFNKAAEREKAQGVLFMFPRSADDMF